MRKNVHLDYDGDMKNILKSALIIILLVGTFILGYESRPVPELSLNQHYIAVENRAEYTQFIDCIYNNEYTDDEYVYLYCYNTIVKGMHPWTTAN